MGNHVAIVYHEFKQTQNLDDHFGYWNESTGPEGPLAKLRELTREELTRIKVYQGLAKQRRLIEKTDFRHFQEEFESENARRLAAKKAGQVVYGPAQFQLATFYSIRFGDLAYKLKQSLAKEIEPSISEQMIRQFFEENESILEGKPLDEVLRKRILSALAEKQADAQLNDFCASAVVEFKGDLLKEIVPRRDLEPAAAGEASDPTSRRTSFAPAIASLAGVSQ